MVGYGEMVFATARRGRTAGRWVEVLRWVHRASVRMGVVIRAGTLVSWGCGSCEEHLI